MDFSYTISILKSGRHIIPENKQAEIDLVVEILSKSKGYLTKDRPTRIVFYDDDRE